ncbi:MAG: HAMP domain-containing sensor histidine kinase [Bacillota bacterium]|nr:HAMP domain-containing sensor histidine kinase [Bacillota bacterium]
MKKRANVFQQISLTRQVVLLIMLSLILFLTVFAFFVSSNINKSLATQMYDQMENRQESIISLMTNTEFSLKKGNTNTLMDSFQVNCLITEDGQFQVLNGQTESVDNRVFTKMLEEARTMFPVNDVREGTYALGENVYYYRLVSFVCDYGDYILASFMDDTFSTTLKKTVVDSSMAILFFSFLVILITLMIWVVSIIHPLNQIKTYIDKFKKGEEVELYLNRGDEIGEVADALVNLTQEVKKQERIKEEMIHNISHDLKTPIATIKSYSESIKDGIYPYGDLDSSVDVILDNANRLEKKVYNLLYLNRVEYLVTTDAQGVVTNMKDVVQEVVLNSAVIKPEIQMIVDVEEVFFDGLLEAWRVAIENILDNAFRYAKSYIKIEVHENDLKISNDGSHLDEKRLQSLFRPYEKGEGGKFGLGLSIVNKVVKVNNYQVEGYNTNDGVCFHIYRKEEPRQKKMIRRQSWNDNDSSFM